MKIINSSIEIMHSGLETEFIKPERFIEKVGRTCYKSEDKITDTSAEKFVSGLVKRGHEAMIEHWNLIFQTDGLTYSTMQDDWLIMMDDVNMREDNLAISKPLRAYLRFTEQGTDDGDLRYIVSGNIRAWRDFANACVSLLGYIPPYIYGMIRNNPLFFPEYQAYVPAVIVNTHLIPITEKDLVGPVEHGVHHCVTVKFICDRGVSHEIVRHRTASFAQESTRYCNYGLGKFGSEITVVAPAWCDETEPVYYAWKNCCESAEKSYFELMEVCSPQEARSVLPNSLKTEVIMTGNLDCWDHFFNLRCAPDAHPDIQVVAKMVRDEFQKLFPERYA